MQNYRSLRAWRQAFSLALNVRDAMRLFPKSGYGELKGQTLSSAESVVHNIVEGCGASTQREFARFLGIAIKSTMELEGRLQLAHGYGVLPPVRWRSLELQVIDARRMLVGLRQKVLGAHAAQLESFPPRDLS